MRHVFSLLYIYIFLNHLQDSLNFMLLITWLLPFLLHNLLIIFLSSSYLQTTLVILKFVRPSTTILVQGGLCCTWLDHGSPSGWNELMGMASAEIFLSFLVLLFPLFPLPSLLLLPSSSLFITQRGFPLSAFLSGYVAHYPRAQQRLSTTGPQPVTSRMKSHCTPMQWKHRFK